MLKSPVAPILGHRAVLSALVLSFAAIGSASAQNSSISTAVAVDTGSLQGSTSADKKITIFKGIPFAAPPVGDLRFKPPISPAKWNGVRDATRFGASCMQTIRSVTVGGRAFAEDTAVPNEVSEDCLSLNVWTPAKKTSEKLPVMVWIYGGGFNVGSTSVPIYDGEGLSTKGVVVVSINYRLGIYGFLAHPELDKESSRKVSGNYGILDQVAALQWIQRNIDKFGGDPSRVTIFGQSAGGGSVHFLASSPLAKGLMSGAIAQNGLMASNDPFLNERSPSAYKLIAKAETDNVEYLRKGGVTSLAQLRAMTPEQISNLPKPPFPPAFFSPIVDGWVLPREFGDIYAAGSQNDIPFMAGWTSSYYSALKITVPEYRSWAKARFGAFSDRFLALYPAANDAEALQRVEESTQDSYRSSLFLWATERRQHGSANTYIYYFNHELPGSDKNGWGARAGHDIPYAMNSLSRSRRPLEKVDHDLATVVSAYWSNFAKRDDPNGQGLPHWGAYDPAKPIMMQLGDGTKEIPVTSPEKLAFYRDFFKTKPQCPWSEPCSINVP